MPVNGRLRPLAGQPGVDDQVLDPFAGRVIIARGMACEDLPDPERAAAVHRANDTALLGAGERRRL